MDTNTTSESGVAFTLADLEKAKKELKFMKPHISQFAGIPIIENPMLKEWEIMIVVGPNTIDGLTNT